MSKSGYGFEPRRPDTDQPGDWFVVRDRYGYKVGGYEFSSREQAEHYAKSFDGCTVERVRP